jgi:ubiquitin carboxyl-terminal hydrolase 31
MSFTCCLWLQQSSIGRPDEVVAAEALANHTRCNNSYIYDLFQALYRSSLTCPSCHHRSNTFDPFLSVSLPIPHKSQQAVFVTVVRLSSAITESSKSRYIKMGFLVNPDEVVYELRSTVAEKANVADAAVSWSFSN